MRAPGLIVRLGAAGLAGLLAGCTLWAPVPEATPPAARPDSAELRLIEAAERAERALASLALALPVPHPAYAMPAPDSVPPALRTPVTLDWIGPLETLAAALARRAGYRFHVAGRPPARPPIVAVEARQEPLLAVLRDAGLQAGGAAVLTVDAARETVLLDWTPDARSPEEGV